MKSKKVLLFVDNAPSHAVVNLKNLTVKYLTANTRSMSLFQSMDQGIIQLLSLNTEEINSSMFSVKWNLSQVEVGLIC